MAMAPTRYASLGHFGMRIFHLECLCNSSLYVCNTYRTQTVFANAAVMVVVGIEIEREGGQQRWARYSTRGATVPRVLFARWRRLGFWGCRGAGNAGRGVPTAGKREGISF